MQTPEERRKFARLNILVDVSYSKHHSEEKEKLSLTRNISKGGICFVGYEKVKEQETIDLNVYLASDQEPVRAVGKVIWVKEFCIGDNPKNKRYDVGVEFVEISDADLTQIDRYMEQRGH